MITAGSLPGCPVADHVTGLAELVLGLFFLVPAVIVLVIGVLGAVRAVGHRRWAGPVPSPVPPPGPGGAHP
ncbi:hypothetical protein ACFXI8_20185 [Streptomyces niveus]|uniref:hypothetical protein n=1 Tax=Streptomyces niveus TaxID=193462 RepID=UPI0036AEFB04